MADNTNEDNWLYGSSHANSTTNEDDNSVPLVEIKEDFENEAEALLSSSKTFEYADKNYPEKETEVIGHVQGYGELADRADEMEKVEEVAGVADTTDVMKSNETVDPTGEQFEPRVASIGSEEDDEDDSDDDINVVIGDINAAPKTYNIKQCSNILADSSTAQENKKSNQSEKLSADESVGTLKGIAAHEFSIDSLDEKPWRKPGADITDYFNFGFNEDTWRAYCERQRRVRVTESGVGLACLMLNLNTSNESHQENAQDNAPLVDVKTEGNAIGNVPIHQMLPTGITPNHHQQRHMIAPRGTRPSANTKGNAIQVMTAECREYSRTGAMPPIFAPPVQVDVPFLPQSDALNSGYEPMQESQWVNDTRVWIPTVTQGLTSVPNITSVIQELTSVPNITSTTNNLPASVMVEPIEVPQPMRGLDLPTIPEGIPPTNSTMGTPCGMDMVMDPGTVGSPVRKPMGLPRLMDVATNKPMGLPRLMDVATKKPMVLPRLMDVAASRMERERPDRGDHERDHERDRERRVEKDRDSDRKRDRDYDRSERKDRLIYRERDRGIERERFDRKKAVKDQDSERTYEDRDRKWRERERERQRERLHLERSRSCEKSSRRRSKSREKDRNKERERGCYRKREKVHEKVRDRERSKDVEKVVDKDREKECDKDCGRKRDNEHQKERRKERESRAGKYVAMTNKSHKDNEDD